MSIIQNKVYLRVFFIISCFLFCSCIKSFRSHFANPIDWIPKHSYTLEPESGVAPVLSDKIPLVLKISFDTEWNTSNRPPRLDPWEDYSVNESMIDFLIKDIRVEGGSGGLFYRTEIDGKSSIGEPFDSGSKVKNGDTKLYYVPDTKDDCYTHKLSLVSTILTVDYDREAGKPVHCSLKLGEPSYRLEASTEANIAYVEDKGTPIKVVIASDNALAKHQQYRLISWYVTGGKGTMYVGSNKKPVSTLMPLHFGSNTLFYLPDPGSDGTHTIYIEVGNIKGYTTKESSFSVKVQDHRIADFTAELSMASEEAPLLPFKDRVCKLKLKPLTDAGKVLHYHIKAIKMNGGKLILGKDEMIEGTPLTVGVNALMFNPCGSVGDLAPSITIVNEKGDEREVTFKKPFIVKDPAFKVVASLEGSIENGMDNRYINLNIVAPFNTTSDKFVLSNYRLSGGISGDLLKITGDPATIGGMLSVGDSAFKFKLASIDEFMDKIDGAPKLYFDITYPDGTHHETEPVDLSIFLFEALASKLASLNNDGKDLYKPLVKDYNMPSAPALQILKYKESAWSKRHSNLHDILVYMQHDTIVSPQVTDLLDNLQTFKKDTKDKINKRVLTTQFLNRWSDEIHGIDSSQDPDDCRIRVDRLSKETKSFSDIFHSCRDIPGMEDVTQSIDDVLEKIEKLKRETEEKQAYKDKKKSEYKDFKDRTTRSIKNEQETRESQVEGLEKYIKELCASRDDIERNIRLHDGDISRLHSLMEELSRVNSELRSRCNSLQSQSRTKDERLDDIVRRILPLEAFNAKRKWYKKTHIPGDDHPYNIAQSLIKKGCYSLEEIVRLSAVPKDKVEDLMKPSRDQICGWGTEWRKYSDERERELIKKNLS